MLRNVAKCKRSQCRQEKKVDGGLGGKAWRTGQRERKTEVGEARREGK